MDAAVATLRVAAANLSRDINTIRVLTDQKVPLFLPTHPRGVVAVPLKGGPIADDGHELKGEWFYPKGNKSPNIKGGLAGLSKVVLYFHGGAFCLCTPGTHRGVLLRLADACKGLTILGV